MKRTRAFAWLCRLRDHIPRPSFARISKGCPSRTRYLYGGHFPIYTDRDRRITPLVLRGIEKTANKLLHTDERVLSRIALKQFLRREKITAVLAEYGPTGAELAEICADLNIPLIVYFLGYDAYMDDILATYPYATLFAHASAIIGVSTEMTEQLVSLGAPRDKVFYNPCGANTSLYQAANVAANPPHFVSVGRFVDKKAPYLLILAFEKVVAEVPDARLFMVGDGILQPSCAILIRSLHLNHAVTLLGVRTLEEIAELMQGMRAFVQHSVVAPSGDREGTPVSIMEACAAGLPIVATRHAGIRDLVIEEETGLLVDEGDIQSMADHMIRLVRDPEFAAKLGQAGRRRVEQTYSLEATNNQLWQIIRSVLNP